MIRDSFNVRVVSGDYTCTPDYLFFIDESPVTTSVTLVIVKRNSVISTRLFY